MLHISRVPCRFLPVARVAIDYVTCMQYVLLGNVVPQKYTKAHKERPPICTQNSIHTREIYYYLSFVSESMEDQSCLHGL